MSKWFNAPFKRVCLSLLLAGALVGCQREEANQAPERVRTSTIVEPETSGIDSVPEEEPAVARNSWRAASDNARSTTGNLRVSLDGVRGGPVIFAFANGITVNAQPIAAAPADSRSGVGGQSYAAIMGGDPRVHVYLYRVIVENVASNVRSGGLCGPNPTRHLAVSEFVDSAGRWTMRIAAFRSERPPGVSGDDPLLCAAYSYLAPG